MKGCIGGKTDDGVVTNSVSGVCWMCGEKFTQKRQTEDTNLAEWQDTTKHADWCEKITRKIYERYGSTFREIYNVLELSLPEDKAKIAKDLVGNKLMEARNDAIKIVMDFFNK